MSNASSSNTSSYPVSTIAKLFDLTERRIQQLAAERIIPKAIKGMYELGPSVQNYIKYLRERSLNKDGTTSNIGVERVRLVKMQADKLEQDMKLRNEDLLERDEVKEGWIYILTRCRALLLGIPNKLAYQLASISNPQEVAQLLKKSIYEALEELANNNDIAEVNEENENNQTTNKDSNQDKESNNAEDNVNRGDVEANKQSHLCSI